ncbi:MAG: sugar ABC transporter permease [Defluviitaleaceae bacterium]|nr:sugar ABC transporter permease [Defluviitaleaceae bacterium]MCL2274830.1 sugar ABC transporter permease [Defluviitaleaceae bacterium]
MVKTRKVSLLHQMKRSWVSYVMLAPFFTLFFIFTVLPILSSAVLGFTSFNMLETPRFVGFNNFRHLLVNDDVFWIAFRNTMIFALVTGPLGYVLMVFLAWFINEIKGILRTILTLLIYAPSMMGTAFFIWFILFSPDAHGYINGFLMRWNIIHEPIEWLLHPDYVLGVIMLVQIWISMGVGFLAVLAGFKTVDRTYYEAAALDGVRNRFQELWHVTLPLIAPQMFFAAIMQLAGSFAVWEISVNLAGFPSTEYAASTIVTHIVDYAQIRYELGMASALAVILFILMLVINVGLRRMFINKVGN